MSYTVQQLARMADISVRTLHYYDEYGLLEPSYIEKNGYRRYEERELLKLQQILFFRELEFPLDEIKKIITSPHFDIVEALNDHKRIIEVKKKRLDGLLKTIHKTMIKMKSNKKDKKIDDTELFHSFDTDEMNKYQEEAKEKWGNTEAYKQSQERVKKMGKEGLKKISEEGEKIVSQLGKNMDEGIESPIIQKLIGEYHTHLSKFYDISLEMYQNLGKMYVDDSRFTKYYDKHREGLAVFVRDAIAYYCSKKRKN